MQQSIIGKIRTFERYLGQWKIIKILENQNIILTLQLDTTKCRHCEKEVYPPRNYIFEYFEVLKEGKRTLTLGNTNCGHCVILDEYISKEKIEGIIGKF